MGRLALALVAVGRLDLHRGAYAVRSDPAVAVIYFFRTVIFGIHNFGIQMTSIPSIGY
jgi:hypothetical protein